MSTTGTRALLLLGIIVWALSLSLFSENPLEHELYDLQSELLLLREGDPRLPESLVMAAIDREAYQKGLRKSHIPEVVKSLEGQVVDINEKPLGPFLDVDSDGVLRSVQLFERRGERLNLCPPLLDYLEYKNLSSKDVRIATDGLLVGDEKIVTDSTGRFYPFFPVTDQYELRAKQMGLSRMTESDFLSLATKPSFEPVTVTVLAEKSVSLEDRVTLVGMFLKEAESIELDTPGGSMVELQLYASVLLTCSEATISSRCHPWPIWSCR